MATGEPPGVPPISALTRKAWWRLSTKSAGEICKTSINRRACNGVNFCPEAWWLQRRGNAPDADAMERLSAGSLSHRRIELSTRAVSMHAAQTPDRGRQRQLRAARSNLRQLRRASLSGPTAPRLRTTAPSVSAHFSMRNSGATLPTRVSLPTGFNTEDRRSQATTPSQHREGKHDVSRRLPRGSDAATAASLASVKTPSGG